MIPHPVYQPSDVSEKTNLQGEVWNEPQCVNSYVTPIWTVGRPKWPLPVETVEKLKVVTHDTSTLLNKSLIHNNMLLLLSGTVKTEVTQICSRENTSKLTF